MKANTTTALALTGSQTLIPKPTKTEIIEAMVARAKVKHDAENSRRSKLREALRKKIEAAAVKAVKAKTPYVAIYCGSSDPERRHCDVRFDRVTSLDLAILFDRYNEVAQIQWDEKDVRKSIRQELSGVGKLSSTRLLDNPEAVKAIDSKLAEWGI